MNRKTIVTALLLCVTLYAPLSLLSQSQDFEMDGTVLVEYKGNAANVTIPAGVTFIKFFAFSECSSLVNVTIPESVTSIGAYAFSKCTRLTSVAIPTSVTSIGEMAFYECSSLASITIPTSVTSIGAFSFYGCNNLKTVTVSRKTTIGQNAFPNTAQITYSD